MISSEGYKAFYGTMRITPKNPNMEPFDLTCDWLYKPEYQYWYGKGRSFMEEICTVLVDLTAAPSLVGGKMHILTGPGDSTIEIVKPVEGNADDHLAECPFCGGTGVFYEKYRHKAGERWRCWCATCLACIDPGCAQDRSTVRRMWNRRTPPAGGPPSQGVPEDE